MARTEQRGGSPGVMDPQSALGFLAQASGLLAASLDYERTLTEVARLAVPDVADWCAIDVVQPDGSTRQVTSVHPNPEHEAFLLELRRRYRAEKRGSEGTAHVIATAEPELASDVTSTVDVTLVGDEGDLYRRLAPRSYMIVPLVARGRTLGALTLLSTREGRHYNDSDLDFAMHLGRRFALAVDNARLYDEAERSRGLLDTLFASAPVGLGFFDVDLRCVRANEALAAIDGRGVDQHPGAPLEELLGPLAPVAMPLYRHALTSGEAILEQEISGEARGGVPGAVRHWLLSCTPVRGTDGATIGVSSVMIDVTERRALLERERAGRRRAHFLARASELLESSLDFETTLRNVAEILVPEIVDWCAIHVLDESGEIRLVAISHADPERARWAWELERRYPTDPDAAQGAAAVMRSGSTELTPEITDELLAAGAVDEEHLEILRGLGLHGAIVAPLRARGRTLGTITCVAAESHRTFTRDDVDLVEELARRAALSVDNARLYTERSRIAHTLQAELLPARLPEIPGVRVAVRYRAAGELNEVGGDFYDVFERRGGGWAFEIGDVSGKGAEAAAVTALARHTVRTASLQPAAPTELLETLNDALLSQRAGSEFCTVCLACLTMHEGDRAGTLTVALGGHPPALVLRADGSVEAHGVPGTLMGVFPDPEVTEVDAELRPGDTVLLYTDGVTEAGPVGEEIGDDGLAAILASLHGMSPDEIVDAVERAAVAIQDGQPRDDIALVAFALER
jgi:serine phosphatase RsbU (regulator of sigma subunit)/PAS domain-containing protein